MRLLSRFSTAPALLVRVAISLAAVVSFGAGLTVYVSGRVPFGESLPLAGALIVLVAAITRGGIGRQEEAILAPIWKLPAEARRPLKQMWTQRRFFEALGSQIETISESARQLMTEAAGGYDGLPLAVVTSDTASDHRQQADLALARSSSRSLT